MALVCRRFQALCSAPELLHNVAVDVPGAEDPQQAPAEVEAARMLLLRWLAPRAAHVRRLDLRAWLSRELGNALECSLPAMNRLQHLTLHSRGELALLRADMRGLTQLRSVRLVGYPLRFDAALRLPPSLARVELCDDRITQLPQQVREP